MQDMTQATPAQELVAKDLHGFEWHFKHIFRGNYLTTSSPIWFDNHKNMIAMKRHQIVIWLKCSLLILD